MITEGVMLPALHWNKTWPIDTCNRWTRFGEFFCIKNLVIQYILYIYVFLLYKNSNQGKISNVVSHEEKLNE